MMSLYMNICDELDWLTEKNFISIQDAFKGRLFAKKYREDFETLRIFEEALSFIRDGVSKKGVFIIKVERPDIISAFSTALIHYEMLSAIGFGDIVYVGVSEFDGGKMRQVLINIKRYMPVNS